MNKACDKKDPTKIGGFSIRSNDSKIICKVGSGFKDKTLKADLANPMGSLDRATLFKIMDRLIGRIIEVECNGLTKSKDPNITTYSLFLPIMKLWRDDKEFANNMEDVFPGVE